MATGHKFEPGDLVRYIGADILGCFTYGKIYAVGGRRNGELTVGVISNDTNREDGYTPEFFELASGPW